MTMGNAITRQGQEIALLKAEIQALKARVNTAITLTGAIRLDPAPIGLLPIHGHQGTGGGGQLDHGLALTGLVPDDDHTQYVLRAILTTKGDIFGRTAAVIARLAVGADGQALLADSLQAIGLRWGAPAPAAHDILSAAHGDTDPAAVSRGSLMLGDATPDWAELVIGAVNEVLVSDGTDATWALLDHTTIAGYHDHTYQEDKTGETDGVKTDFITANEFVGSSTVVFLNGALQRPGIGPVNDYFEGPFNDEIIFVVAPAPGDELILAYLIA